MKFSAEIKGGKRLVAALEKLPSLAKLEFLQALKNGAILIHGEAVKSIQAHRSKGIRYGNHVASKPGNPPNTDTGLLVSSIQWEIDQNKMRSVVGTNLDYGRDLEIKRDRAWLQPAYLKTLPAVKRLFRVRIARKV